MLAVFLPVNPRGRAESQKEQRGYWWFYQRRQRYVFFPTFSSVHGLKHHSSLCRYFNRVYCFFVFFLLQLCMESILVLESLHIHSYQKKNWRKFSCILTTSIWYMMIHVYTCCINIHSSPPSDSCRKMWLNLIVLVSSHKTGLIHTYNICSILQSCLYVCVCVKEWAPHWV